MRSNHQNRLERCCCLWTTFQRYVMRQASPSTVSVKQNSIKYINNFPET